jgi:hypothetical protein
MSRLKFHLGIMLALGLSLAACGQQPSALSPAASPAAAVNSAVCYLGFGIQDWNNPIQGDSVSDMAQASPQLNFQPRMPNGLGNPARIVLTPPADQISSGAPRGLELIFDQQPYGRVVVLETVWKVPGDFGQWLQYVVATGRNPCGPPSEATTVRGGLPTLLSSPDGSRWALLWLEGKVRFDVGGPTLSRDQVLAIANGS